MKRRLVLCIAMCLVSLQAAPSVAEMETFYDEYVLEENGILFVGGRTPSPAPIPIPTPTPPSPPPAPATRYDPNIPVVLVNNSGFQDTQIYITVIGMDPATGANNGYQGILNLDPTGPMPGLGTWVYATNLPNGSYTTYSYQLSSLPFATSAQTSRVLYLPTISSGRIYFSINSQMPVTIFGFGTGSGATVNTPDFITSTLVFDKAEVSYLTGSTIPIGQISANITLVDYVSIPLYMYVANGSPTANAGIYYPKSSIVSQCRNFFTTAINGNARTQWNNLILKNGSSVLRVLSPQNGINGGVFDQNYLDNAAAYGYSYLQNIWTGGSAFYKTHSLSLSTYTVPTVYTGTVNGSNQFVFTNSTGGIVTIQPTPSPSLTAAIFNGNISTAFSMATSGSATTRDAMDLAQTLEAGIMAGLIPETGTTLSRSYYFSNSTLFYKSNAQLATSPWYNLYSAAIDALQPTEPVYTWGWSDMLYSNVGTGTSFTNGSTYIGITIINSQ